MISTEKDGQFPQTSWTRVRRLRDPDERLSEQALEEICRQYQYPLYCYIRRRGLEHHDAQDALQDFFGKLIRLRTFSEADVTKGRLRALLATSLHRFLQNWRRDRAHLDKEMSVDVEFSVADSEERYRRESFVEKDTPERIFDRRWSCELLQRVLKRVAEAYCARGRANVFETLRPALLAGGTLKRGEAMVLAARLGINENALYATLSRLLREFRSVLEREVLKTVGSRQEMAAEIAHLLQAFR